MDYRTNRAVSLYARIVRAERRLDQLRQELLQAVEHIPGSDMAYYIEETTRMENKTSGVNIYPHPQSPNPYGLGNR